MNLAESKTFPCKSKSRKSAKGARFTFALSFFEQKIEFAHPDIAANLIIPLLFVKCLIPLVELRQIFLGKGLDGRFDLLDAHGWTLRRDFRGSKLYSFMVNSLNKSPT